MKYLIYCLCLLPVYATGQMPKEPPSFEYANGTLEMPSLLSIDLSQQNNGDFYLNNWSDFTSGKEYLSICNLTVMGNSPWLINVRAEDPYFTSVGGANTPQVPVEMMEVRIAPGTYKTLSTTPCTLLQSNNSNIVNSYPVDLKFKRPFGLEGGKYQVDIRFIVTTQ